MAETKWLELGGIAQLVAAVGTIGLAIFTARMAKRTHDLGKEAKRQGDASDKLVKAASKQLEITRLAFQASIRPWLIAPRNAHVEDRPGSKGSPEGVYVTVRLKNVGSGLAIIRSSECKIFGRDGQNSDWREFTTGATENPVVAPKEDGAVEFVIVKNSGGWTNIDVKAFTGQRIGTMQGTDGQFFADVVYGDSMSELKTRARFYFAYVLNTGWINDSVSYFTPPESPQAEIIAGRRA